MRGGGDASVRGGDDNVTFALEPLGDGVRCTDFADLVSTFVGV